MDMKGNPAVVKRGGTIYGFRLTLNIERDEYWDLVSPEYGVRILVHPYKTYPTLQRGGIIASPGRSIHIGVKRRVTTLLPGHNESCTENFETSQMISYLKKYHLDYDVKNLGYTYEYCNTLCMNYLLFKNCECIEESPHSKGQGTKWNFCNPCNKTQAKCRSRVLRNFTDAGNLCDNLCKPSCSSVRYDVSLSKADWPNLYHQQLVLNRSAEKWSADILKMLEDFDGEADMVKAYTTFRQNMLRVHVFVEEMIYLAIEENYSYTLPKLMADLGGCLGLYLGVSVLSIIELLDLLGSSLFLVSPCGRKKSPRKKPHKTKKDKIAPSAHYPSSRKSKRSQFKFMNEQWDSGFSPREAFPYADMSSGKHVIRRF